MTVRGVWCLDLANRFLLMGAAPLQRCRPCCHLERLGLVFMTLVGILFPGIVSGEDTPEHLLGAVNPPDERPM